MAKKIIRISLSENDKFDFLLIGIVCNHRDYRLCRELNRKLEINLHRGDDYVVYNNKRMEEQSFSFYEYVTEHEDRFNVISNKSTKGHLLPEQNQIDFLLLIRMAPLQISEQNLIDMVKEIPIVLAAYKLETVKLKSRENLVF